jgi:hypothetical protein
MKKEMKMMKDETTRFETVDEQMARGGIMLLNAQSDSSFSFKERD